MIYSCLSGLSPFSVLEVSLVLLWFSYFLGRVSSFCPRLVLDHNPPTSCIAGIKVCTTTSSLFVEVGSQKFFFAWLAWNCDSLSLCLLISWDYRCALPCPVPFKILFMRQDLTCTFAQASLKVTILPPSSWDYRHTLSCLAHLIMISNVTGDLYHILNSSIFTLFHWNLWLLLNVLIIVASLPSSFLFS
jgi:hypothetical protein